MNLFELRQIVSNLLEQYEFNQGIGPDAYHSVPMSHAMADAKYIAAVLQYHSCGLLNKSNLLKKVNEALSRIKKSAIYRIDENERLALWGLGFPWQKHNFDHNTPLLINTAIVVKALNDLFNFNLLPIEYNELRISGNKGLVWWLKRNRATISDGSSLPSYALENYRAPVLNTASYGISTFLYSIRGSDASMCKDLDYVFDQYVEGCGWTYAEDNSVIDLLHQWYIINSLFPHVGYEKLQYKAQNIIGQFMGTKDFFDTALLLHSSWNADENDIGFVLYRQSQINVLAIKPKPARLWSLGEMLLGVSKFCSINKQNSLFPRYAHFIIKNIINIINEEQNQELKYPRHTMHLAHGLTAYLSYKRQKTII